MRGGSGGEGENPVLSGAIDLSAAIDCETVPSYRGKQTGFRGALG